MDIFRKVWHLPLWFILNESNAALIFSSSSVEVQTSYESEGYWSGPV